MANPATLKRPRQQAIAKHRFFFAAPVEGQVRGDRGLRDQGQTSVKKPADSEYPSSPETVGDHADKRQREATAQRLQGNGERDGRSQRLQVKQHRVQEDPEAMPDSQGER